MKKQKQIQTTVSTELKNFFKQHIGRENGATREEILTKFFGLNHSYYENYYNWVHKILPTLHNLRRYSKTFVISMAKDRKMVFFVIREYDELENFEQKTLKAIKGNKSSMAKARKAVAEQWWKEL